jgi:hypothetical protein
MTKRRVRIGNLKIRMPRTANGDPARLAAEIGRQVMRATARLSKGKTGSTKVNEIPVGRISMSDDIGKQIASTLNRKLNENDYGGKR